MHAGMRAYMEDRYSIIASYQLPAPGLGGMPLLDGVTRSFAAVFDGHNGSKAADHASDRFAEPLPLLPMQLVQYCGEVRGDPAMAEAAMASAR